MRKVTAIVDFTMDGPNITKRTNAFLKLCNLLMLLRCWHTTQLRDKDNPGWTKTWSIDWAQHPRKPIV